MSEWSLVFSFSSALTAAVAAIFSTLTFFRTFFRELPTVEFLVKYGRDDQKLYKLSVSNPTHRLLVLDHVKVLSPSADVVEIKPEDDNLDGVIDRAIEETSLPSGRTKPVFLTVPAGQTRCLEITFGYEFLKSLDAEGFEVDFRLCWSKGLPRLEQWFIARKIQLDSAQVKSRNLAASVDHQSGSKS